MCVCVCGGGGGGRACHRVGIECMCVSRLLLCHKGYAAAGVQFGHECWCGSSTSYANANRQPETVCNKPCPGDRSQMCGAGCKMNIYDTELLGELSLLHLAPSDCRYVCIV